ncbi:MAG: hypothetical protein KAU22_05170 [Desulfuromonadales bacterium]|nr:hypothetical protein [Desulfuromonadales bacterium]
MMIYRRKCRAALRSLVLFVTMLALLGSNANASDGHRYDSHQKHAPLILAAKTSSSDIPIAVQPRQTIPKSPIQSKTIPNVPKFKMFTYSGKQARCELPSSQLAQGDAVGLAPGPGLPYDSRSDLTVLGVKHMVVTRDGNEYVKVVTKISNSSDEPMLAANYKVFFKIGGEMHACVATLPRLGAHQMVNLSREIQLQRGLNFLVTVNVDFLNTEQERNEDNNKYIYTIHVN